MSWAFCATTIEESLSQGKGIKSARVLMNTNEVIVCYYNPQELDHNSIKKHLTQPGYYAFDKSKNLHNDETVLKDSRKMALAADAITAPVTVVAFLSSMLGLFDFDILVKPALENFRTFLLRVFN